MNKKALTAIIVFTFISSLVAGMQSGEVAEANPLPPSWMNPKMTITIQSPQNGTDNALPVFVKFTAQSSSHFSLSDNQTQDWIRAFFYVLDGQNMSSSGIRFTETKITATYPGDNDHYYDFSGQAYLTDLTDGSHTITVYYGALVNVGSPYEFIAYNASWSATSQFYVTSPSPSAPEFPALIILPIFVMATLAILVYFKKRKS